MTPLMFIGFVTYLVLQTLAYLEAQTPSSYLHFESVYIGSNITLKCSYKETDGVVFYWYKQTLGQKPQLISEVFKYRRNGLLKGEIWNDSRFDLEFGNDKNHLKIFNVQMSDSATYYCTGIDAYVYEFIEGIIVYVKESDKNIWTLVNQSRSETIQSGGSVTLSCAVQTVICDGEHNVYWFHNSEEYLPRIIYSHGASADNCERTPATQTRSCVYSLTIESLNASNAGTYHCAVASCGLILFGKGMKLDFEKKFDSPVLLYVLSGTSAFSIILVFFLAYKLFKTKSCKGKGYEDADNLHYAALSHSKVSRSRGQRDNPNQSVYSSVRH
ncbi:uncharacterized protein LOC124880348 [Girardinichthys multiradiatus]|uniref:uncharacterized protein LOC124880348 n=1 Tax=Girardinichthys multiradiatus TaxID=208333 RepID=UPI001FAC96AF|nr:uncharacterized protein LOC124880348 [Girardinichthys multiradiatus]